MRGLYGRSYGKVLWESLMAEIEWVGSSTTRHLRSLGEAWPGGTSRYYGEPYGAVRLFGYFAVRPAVRPSVRLFSNESLMAALGFLQKALRRSYGDFV